MTCTSDYWYYQTISKKDIDYYVEMKCILPQMLFWWHLFDLCELVLHVKGLEISLTISMQQS